MDPCLGTLHSGTISFSTFPSPASILNGKCFLFYFNSIESAFFFHPVFPELLLPLPRPTTVLSSMSSVFRNVTVHIHLGGGWGKKCGEKRESSLACILQRVQSSIHTHTQTPTHGGGEDDQQNVYLLCTCDLYRTETGEKWKGC